ncbi:MAG: stage II sporulation protein P [Tissierellaceae bacterium]
MGKTRKSDYIILALACVLVLNIGNILIRFSPRTSRFVEDGYIKKISSSLVDTVGLLNIDDLVSKIIDSLFPTAEVSNLERDGQETDFQIHEFNEVDEDMDYDNSRDIILDRLDEYESLIIIRDSMGKDIVENIPEPLMINKMIVDREKPYILIYHTHATESYNLSKADNYRSSDKDINVVGIGKIMSNVLEAGGHKVNHVEVYHDLPSYNQSYSRSLNTIMKKKEESDNLRVLLDIHRDAYLETNPNMEAIRAKSKTNIDGKSVATFSLVVGPDTPNMEQVLNFTKYIKAVSDALYPNLCTGIIIKPTGKYNQHLSDYSALMEIGYNFNTLEEAEEGAKLVGRVLSVAINSIIEE